MGESIQKSPSWQGSGQVKHFIIFGDSYTDVGYNSKCKHPTREQPLGIEFPGCTWAESGQPNWVGHLVKDYTFSPVLAYDYAVGGDTVAGVARQINRHFLPTVGKKPDWAPWTAEDSLFVTWIGINDCSWGATESNVVELFGLQEKLYEVGARNFCLIDVPPIERSPMAMSRSSAPYDNWNAALRRHCKTFAEAHPDATVFIYSSHRTFNRILSDPVSHGFSSMDAVKPYAEIWVDQLHPTSRMHDWIAKDFAAFLNGRKPFGDGEGDTAESASTAESSRSVQGSSL